MVPARRIRSGAAAIVAGLAITLAATACSTGGGGRSPATQVPSGGESTTTAAP